MALGKKMKAGFNKTIFNSFIVFFGLAIFAQSANAFGTIIYAAMIAAEYTAIEAATVAFIVTLAVSMVVAKAAASGLDNGAAGDSPNPGNRQSFPPATDNKIPVAYGTAWIGGIITDMTISVDNQWMYYVIALSEVTGANGDATAGDVLDITQVYFGGRRCVFDSSLKYKVVGLQDPSTLVTDPACTDNLNIYLYRNGVNTPINSSFNAYTLMSGGGPFPVNLQYIWTVQKMSNCAFAIVQMRYNQSANLTSFQPMRFRVVNPRKSPASCFYDYMTNKVYGAGIDPAYIDQTSLTSLDVYSNQTIPYTTYSGTTSTFRRFEFNGVIDTNRPVMDNLQEMATCADCLIKYNEITGKWGVIVQQETYTVAATLNDSNLIGAFTINPIDISSSYNVIECKFPNTDYQDSFDSVSFDLKQIAPQLLYPNEPINKQTVTLSLVNSDITAQYIANRLLEAAREDLTLTCKMNYAGIQLEAGDIVQIYNTNYGWCEPTFPTGKLFRVNKVTESFGSDGSITADLILNEFNPQVYDDKNITQFTPSLNTGLPNALTFGTLAAPLVITTTQSVTSPVPNFYVRVTTPAYGIVQYAEIYYSASLSGADAIYVGTTEIMPSGNPYVNGSVMPDVLVTGIAAGNWYFFYRVVNTFGKSALSAPSALLYWRPMTFTYPKKYLLIAYANNNTGTTGFSFNRANKSYFGITNQDDTSSISDPTQYKWYPTASGFGTTQFLLYANWGNRSMSFGVGTAAYKSGSGNFVSTTAGYPDAIWSALIDASNASIQTNINLDDPTGQFIITGTTANSGQLAVQPTADGKLQVSLDKFLNFGQVNGADVLEKTVQPAYLTVDIYGRVKGFEYPDNFYMTITNFNSTNGQTSFPISRAVNYEAGNCLVFQNGILVDVSEYTDSASSVSFTVGRTGGDRIQIISFRSVHLANAGSFVTGKKYTITTVGSTDWNACSTLASRSWSGTSWAVGGTFVASAVGSGTGVASNVYNSFSRFTQTVTSAASVTPTTAVTSGFEYIFVNGVAYYDGDYDFFNGNFTNFPSDQDNTGLLTGTITFMQWAANNLTTPNGNPYVVWSPTASGQTTYSFGLQQYAFNLFMNGVLNTVSNPASGVTSSPFDYTTGSGTYTLANTPSALTSLLLQQTFKSEGAA